jgi:molybdopterin-guanine dinucleotide biosynthesis protein A
VVEVEVFILIGGRSSRFGRDKALVEVNGLTLAQRAVDTAQAALPSSRVTMVAGNDAQVALTAFAAGTPFIFDLYPGRGPLGGLHAALANARSPWVFVFAVDMPLMSVELITLLADRISDEYDAVVVRQPDDRIQPLCAFYNVRACLPIVDAAIRAAGRPRPLHELVAKLNARVVNRDEYCSISDVDRIFRNVNTTADLDFVTIDTLDPE